MASLTWVLESDVFPDSHAMLREAILKAGQRIVDWNDDWWSEGIPSGIGTTPTVFHGSLENAHKVFKEWNWSPGSFCNMEAFHCSSWYDTARDWLLHTDWRILAANEFVANAQSIASDLGSPERLFIRPDSPLKPFSGRIISPKSVTLASLDHGFYFDDETLPIVAAPIRKIGREWRFIVVRDEIIMGSEYESSTRSAVSAAPESDAWAFAADVAASIPMPSAVYVLDVCESDGTLNLLELNPFGGADLYASYASKIVQAVSAVVEGCEL